jgi:hypothetical protein
VFAILTTTLVVLTVAVVVAFAVHALLSALGDVTGARVTRGVAVAGLVLLCMDGLLLLTALGLNAMRPPD